MPNHTYNSIEFSKTEQKQPEPQVFIPSVENSIENVNEVVEKKVVEKPIKTNEKMSSGAKRLLSTNFDVLQINEEWSELMQNPAANLKIAIWGKPKNGKTSASLQMAEYFTNFGMVLYNFADQGFNLSTKQLWIDSGLANNSNAEPSDISTTQELEKEIATGKYKFVFIDMISDYIRKEKLRPEEFKERFIKRFPDVSFILIFEVTKTGDFKGDQGWTHLVDAIMTVENFFMENRGRYGMGERIIWEEGFQRFNPKKYDEYILEKQQREMQNAPSETIKI
jgi:predicted ATP-dependent serine protease